MRESNHVSVIVIGGSAGSLGPLQQIVSALPSEFGAAVFIVQHVHAGRYHLGGAEGDRLRHQMIGHQRQVRAVLLGGTDRDDDGRVREAPLELIAGELREPDAATGRWCGIRHGLLQSVSVGRWSQASGMMVDGATSLPQRAGPCP